MSEFRSRKDGSHYPLHKGGHVTMPSYMNPNVKSPTMLMTKELRGKLPPLYSSEHLKPEQITVHAHYFTPFSSFDWYITEFDGEDRMFGLVKGHEVELGYVSLSELQSQGMNVERDLHWRPVKLSEVMKETHYAGYKPALKPGYKIYEVELLDTDTGDKMGAQIIDKFEVEAKSDNKAIDIAWTKYSQKYNMNAVRSNDPNHGRYVILSGEKKE